MIPMHEADLQTRWESLLRDLFNEALHNLAVEWPDTQSVEVSYRDLERWDLDFAQSLLVQPDLHLEASKQAVKQVLVDEGHGAMDPSFASFTCPRTKRAQFPTFVQRTSVRCSPSTR